MYAHYDLFNTIYRQLPYDPNFSYFTNRDHWGFRAASEKRKTIPPPGFDNRYAYYQQQVYYRVPLVYIPMYYHSPPNSPPGYHSPPTDLNIRAPPFSPGSTPRGSPEPILPENPFFELENAIGCLIEPESSVGSSNVSVASSPSMSPQMSPQTSPREMTTEKRSPRGAWTNRKIRIYKNDKK